MAQIARQANLSISRISRLIARAEQALRKDSRFVKDAAQGGQFTCDSMLPGKTWQLRDWRKR